MSEQNDDGRPTRRSASEDDLGVEPPSAARRGGKIRMLISGVLFVLAAVVTFFAGDDNRWISIPSAIVAAVSLVDFLSVNQRLRRSE